MQSTGRPGGGWVLLAILVWVGAGVGCQESAPPPLTWEERLLERSHGECEDPAGGPCIEVVVRYLEFDGPPAQAAQLNRFVHDLLIGVKGPVTSPEEFAQEFIDNFRNAERDPSVRRNVEASYRVIHHDAHVLSVEVAASVVGTDGRELESTRLGSFSIDQGMPIVLGELLQPDCEAALSALAEKRFREIHEIPDGPSLEEAGYRFPRSTFGLGQTFAVTADGLLLSYYHVREKESTQTQVLLTREDLVDLTIPTGPLGLSR